MQDISDNAQGPTLYLVRHGETDWNEENRIQGRKDRPLTEKGKLQAKRVAEKLIHLDVDKIYTSPLIRAKETSQIISTLHTTEIYEDERLLEADHGDLEGITRDDFKSKFQDNLISHGKLTREERLKNRVAPGCETIHEISERVTPCLLEIATKETGVVVVVCHGFVMRALLIVHGGFDDRALLVRNGGMVAFSKTLEVIGHVGVEERSWI
ncbi:MAG: 2,3-bisphosphoglycerate-dependent phosphoglycerate mutase [Chlamydiia bacterium]|nr:2,3-bisphosphoglycerate-dependent phosphoglycerate mutase [Chlamydiia bacterium]MCH9615754.1 2,3-bisphosphoglycerate-dependent phosphoglycerate mutase [Chlamydiia bacterium]MCH9628843.1 2,3-bisphosphoglycerate-dependent phosphoglycerate mutase [Chlamydiia bacterium]